MVDRRVPGRSPRAAPVAAIAVLALFTSLVGCGDDPSSPDGSAPVATAAPAPLPGGITGTVVLTRQRDLVDRGLVNVLVTNRSDTDLFVHERRLETDGLATETTAGRMIKVGRGRSVAVQTPYGHAVRCEDSRPLRVELAVEFSTADDASARSGVILLEGTDVLDDIRARQCALAMMDEVADVELDDVVVDGEQVRADLRVELVDLVRTIEVGGAGGTILMAAARADDGSPTTVDATRPVVEIPLVFSVNRCDPHALAEVTKRYGLDVDVAFDGGEEVPVAVDVSPLHDQFERAVEACRVRTGG